MTPPDDLKFLEPWRKIERSERAPNREQLFSAELKREVPAGHVLHGLKVRAVAFRIDQDEVLFELEGGNTPLAVVHKTWNVEVDPYWPATELFAVGKTGPENLW